MEAARSRWPYLGTMPDWSAFDDVDPNLPGLVVGVATAGTVTAVGIFGSVSPGGEQLGSSSLFYVASIAKQFTAAAVAVLALDGKLTLDDSVRRWLPELSPAWEPVRVGHLVAHTGGLPDGNAIDADAGGVRVAGCPPGTGWRSSRRPNPPPRRACTTATATTGTSSWPPSRSGPLTRRSARTPGGPSSTRRAWVRAASSTRRAEPQSPVGPAGPSGSTSSSPAAAMAVW